MQRVPDHCRQSEVQEGGWQPSAGRMSAQVQPWTARLGGNSGFAVQARFRRWQGKSSAAMGRGNQSKPHPGRRRNGALCPKTARASAAGQQQQSGWPGLAAKCTPPLWSGPGSMLVRQRGQLKRRVPPAAHSLTSGNARRSSPHLQLLLSHWLLRLPLWPLPGLDRHAHLRWLICLRLAAVGAHAAASGSGSGGDGGLGLPAPVPCG